ncbi:hypothetical protein E1212_01720 [Jiangella ureilytica]|uniref:MarR family transcriptional regulator n=1 Tax=Jiangella ureilytica TaxID=2530374 RepID=A0A4R4S1V6_9ACTN|nr:hypothetical protein [Jiangella ureilytica]TDC56707.1 hypothetical protein E1212_01720 [Jiangella ureilytica]
MTTPLPGVDIGDAAKAVRSLLDVVLDARDVTFAEWVALRTLGTSVERVSQPALRDGVVLALDLDAAEATALLCSLEARGLLCYDGFEQVGLTVDGAVLFDEIQAGVAAITAEVYGGIDAGELATTRRVLASVAARATELRLRL